MYKNNESAIRNLFEDGQCINFKIVVQHLKPLMRKIFLRPPNISQDMDCAGLNAALRRYERDNPCKLRHEK